MASENAFSSRFADSHLGLSDNLCHLGHRIGQDDNPSDRHGCIGRSPHESIYAGGKHH